MPLCKMWWVKNEASLQRSEKGENILKIQVRFRLLEGKEEEDDRQKIGYMAKSVVVVNCFLETETRKAQTGKCMPQNSIFLYSNIEL